jgi:hypothetical protein
VGPERISREDEHSGAARPRWVGGQVGALDLRRQAVATLRNRGEPVGFAKVTAPMVAAAMRRANRKDLERLKATLEHG